MQYLKIKNNLIHKTAIIDWKNVSIGKNNVIEAYAVIGGPAQHPKKKSLGKIVIGNNNKINQFVCINKPTSLTKKTKIGNNNYIMNNSTIDHDCHLEDDITLSSNVILGGNIYIMKGAQLGIKTIIHQNQVIGSFAMLGMGSMVTKTKKILPGYIFFGKPVKKIKKNSVGIRRNNISVDFLKSETKRFGEISKKIKN